jgi:hypothetical protein
MNTTTFVPPALKDYRRQLARDGVMQHIQQTGGQVARGGYACLVAPDHDNQQHLTFIVPLDRAKEWKKLKKQWRKEDIGGSYFYITAHNRQ